MYKDACRKSESKRPSRADCTAIDITVQCENGSFLESPLAEDQLRSGGGTNASSADFNASRLPPSSLLGVPRGTYLDAYNQHHGAALGLREDTEDGSPDEGSRNRKIRSCSSDAAAALQRSEEEATADEGGASFIRRTSDPLCLRRLVTVTEPNTAPETEKQPEVEPACVVQIPVPKRHQLLGRTTSYTDSTIAPAAAGPPSYCIRQPPGYYYAAQANPTPLSVYMASAATGGTVHSTQAPLSGGLYTSPFYSGTDCHDAFVNRDSRMSLCRHQRRHDDTTTMPMMMTTTTTTSAIAHPHHRPQSLLVSHKSRETMTSASPGVAMATAGTKNASRLRRATSLRIHRRSHKAAPPPVDSVYI